MRVKGACVHVQDALDGIGEDNQVAFLPGCKVLAHRLQDQIMEVRQQTKTLGREPLLEQGARLARSLHGFHHRALAGQHGPRHGRRQPFQCGEKGA